MHVFLAALFGTRVLMCGEPCRTSPLTCAWRSTNLKERIRYKCNECHASLHEACNFRRGEDCGDRCGGGLAGTT
jgi:hypothetical protein